MDDTVSSGVSHFSRDFCSYLVRLSKQIKPRGEEILILLHFLGASFPLLLLQCIAVLLVMAVRTRAQGKRKDCKNESTWHARNKPQSLLFKRFHSAPYLCLRGILSNERLNHNLVD